MELLYSGTNTFFSTNLDNRSTNQVSNFNFAMRGVFVATFLIVAVSAITRKLYAPDSPLNGGIPLNLPRGTK